MVAHQYGIQIHKVENNFIKIYIGKWSLLEDKLEAILLDIENDSAIKTVEVNEHEKTIIVLYDEEAINDSENIERWLTLFDDYF